MRDELVMVVPREVLLEQRPFQGFAPDGLDYLAAVATEYLFMPRDRAERDERYKQIIPYVVIQAAPWADRRYRYLMFQRASGGDPRLNRLYSIGLGGHVNSGDVMQSPKVPRSLLEPGRGPDPAAGPDAPSHHQQAVPRRRLVRRVLLSSELLRVLSPKSRTHEHPLFRGLRRELREEVVFPPGCGLEFLGAINDDSSPVGRVHFGLAFLLRVPPVPGWTGRQRGRRTRSSLRHPGARRTVRHPGSGGAYGRPKVRLRREPGSVQIGALFGLAEIGTYRGAMENWSTLLLDGGVLPAVPPPANGRERQSQGGKRDERRH